MRIGINFHTTDRYISGVEYYTLGLLNGLLNIDQQNQYIVYTNQSDLVKESIRPAQNLTIIKVKYLKTRIARILWEHTQLPRLAVKQGLDILHCPSYICPIRKSPIPFVVTIHDTIAIDKPQWCKPTNSLYYNCFMKSAIKKASCIISVSKCTTDDIKRNFNLSRPKIRTVYSGIDSIFNPNRNSLHCQEVRTRYHLPEQYILYVGNIEPKKNIWTLLYLHKRLKQKGLPHKLIIAGRRSWSSRVEVDEISEEIKSNNVIWVGYVNRNDLPCFYQMADVFVFLSLYEGFGFPPLEAMACGTPVVSTYKGALSETIKDAALTVDPFNIQQITQSVISMIQNSSLRKNHIESGHKRIREFDWKRTAKETLSIYQEVS